MDYTKQEWQRAAEYIDGRSIRLTPREEMLVAELCGEEAELESVLDAPAPPPEVAQKAQRTLVLTATALAKKLRLRHAVMAGYSLAAAAALLLATLGLFFDAPPSVVPGPTQYVPTNVLVASLDSDETLSPIAVETELLRSQIETQIAEVAVESLPDPMETNIDAVEESLDNFWVTPTLTLPVNL